MDDPKFIIIGLIVLLFVFGGIVWLSSGGKQTQTIVDQNQPPPPDSGQNTFPSTTDESAKYLATIKTAKGNIIMELYPKAAPKTVANFVDKAKSGYFNGLKFHRVEDWVIQGGDPLSRDDSKKQIWGTGGGNIETELNTRPFVVGALGVARGQDIKISNDSQFFIVKKDSQFLNGQYTLFGQVVSGMDVSNKIAVGDIMQFVTISSTDPSQPPN